VTLSAEFSVNGSSVVQAHAVAYGATVTLQALSLEFHGISWEIVASSKSGLTEPTISLSGAPTGATATFTQVADPGDGLGRSWGIKCTQADAQGNTSIVHRVIGTTNSQGLMPFVNNEEAWRNATHGWTELLNYLLNASGGGGVTDHGGLTGLSDDDHSGIYELWARPLVAYSGAASTAVLADARKHITTSHGSANTLTIPANGSVAYSTSTILWGTNIGAGVMTLTPDTGVTLNAVSLIVPSNATWLAKKTNTNTWYCSVIGSGSSAAAGMGFRYTYSTTTTDADPGAGTFRGNNATLSSVTVLYVDLAEYGGTDVTAWLDSLDDYPGSIKGIVRLSSQSDPTKWIEYTMTAWTTAAGYRKLTVAYKDGPGGLTTTAGDTFFAFDYATSITGGTGVTVSAAGAVALNTVIAPLATAGTGLQLARMNSGGTAAEWFTEPTLPEGAALTNANVTKNISDGSSFTLAASTLASSAKTFTAGTSGTPEVDELMYIAVFAQGQDYLVANGGPLANTVYTVVTGTKRLVALRWDGANWAPAGKWRLN
jgi:hypothetical protein